MNTNEAADLLRTCLHEVAPDVDFASVPAGADFRETVAIDSLDFLQLVELLSKRSGLRIDEDDYPRLSTIDSTVAFLAEAGERR